MTCPEKPNRIASGIRFAADGGYSGPEYYGVDIFSGPVFLVGLLEQNESSIVSRHTCTEYYLFHSIRQAVFFSQDQ